MIPLRVRESTFSPSDKQILRDGSEHPREFNGKVKCLSFKVDLLSSADKNYPGEYFIDSIEC